VAQRIQPLRRLLDSASLGLGVEISCLRRVAARPIRSPFAEDDRIIGLREREVRLGTARLGSALEHNPRRANIPLAEQHARARD